MRRSPRIDPVGFQWVKRPARVTDHDDLGTRNSGAAVERHVKEVGRRAGYLLSLIAYEACQRPAGDSVRRQGITAERREEAVRR